MSPRTDNASTERSEASSLDFNEKLDRINDQQKRAFSTRRFTNIARAGAAVAGRSALEAAQGISERHLTPGFVTKKRQERLQQEEDERKEVVRRQTQIAKEAQFEAARTKRREILTAQANRRRRITQAAQTRQRSHGLKDEFRCSERTKRVAERDERYEKEKEERERRRRAKERAERERVVAEEAKRRNDNAIYWTKQAQNLRAESNERNDEGQNRASNDSKAHKSNTATEETNTQSPVPPLLQHPAQTIFTTSPPLGTGIVESEHFPLFLTKESYAGEATRANIISLQTADATYHQDLKDLSAEVKQNKAKMVELASKKEELRMQIDTHSKVVDEILLSLRKPYPRDPNQEQKNELHSLKVRISLKRKEIKRIERILASLQELAEYRSSALESTTATDARKSIEQEIERLEASIDASGHVPPMVLGTTLQGNPSAICDGVEAMSRLEIQRYLVANALKNCHSIDRPKNRLLLDMLDEKKSHLHELESNAEVLKEACTEEADIDSRRKINNAIQRFRRHGYVLHKTSGQGYSASNKVLQESQAQYLERKKAHSKEELVDDGRYFARRDKGDEMRRYHIPMISALPRIALVHESSADNEDCIYDLSVSSGIHRRSLCHGLDQGGGGKGERGLVSLLLDERLDDQRHRAAYSDIIDALGRIQGFQKKLKELSSTRDIRRKDLAKAASLLCDRRLKLAQDTALLSELEEELAEATTKLKRVEDETHSYNNASKMLDRSRNVLVTAESALLRSSKAILAVHSARNTNDTATTSFVCSPINVPLLAADLMLCEDIAMKAHLRRSNLLSRAERYHMMREERLSCTAQSSAIAEYRSLAFESIYGYGIRQKEALQRLHAAEKEAETMDSCVLTSFRQRWQTKQLQEELEQAHLVRSIKVATSASLVNEANENVESIKASIRCINTEMKTKREAMQRLERRYLRKQRLMLRRSILGQAIFARERKNILCESLRRWKYYTDWHSRHRKAAEMKIALRRNDGKALCLSRSQSIVSFGNG